MQAVPVQPEFTTAGVLDALAIDKAFLVGKDFGSITEYLIAAAYPERISGLISLGIPFMLPGPSAVQNHLLPEGFYITRWQEPGRAEADFGRFVVKSVVRNIYILFSKSEVPIAAKDQEIMDLFDPATPLPPGLSEEESCQDSCLFTSTSSKESCPCATGVHYKRTAGD